MTHDGVEDKTFPKDTGLLAGGRQDLVRIEEFQGKIAAARAATANATCWWSRARKP
jgi:hypothetical protein